MKKATQYTEINNFIKKNGLKVSVQKVKNSYTYSLISAGAQEQMAISWNKIIGNLSPYFEMRIKDDFGNSTYKKRMPFDEWNSIRLSNDIESLTIEMSERSETPNVKQKLVTKEDVKGIFVKAMEKKIASGENNFFKKKKSEISKKNILQQSVLDFTEMLISLDFVKNVVTEYSTNKAIKKLK